MYRLTEYDRVLSQLEELSDALSELAQDLTPLDGRQLSEVIQTCRDLAASTDEARYTLESKRDVLVQLLTPESDEVEEADASGRSSCSIVSESE